MAQQTIRVGGASAQINADSVLLMLDRVTEGAATSFVEKVEAEFAEVAALARPLWPVRSGVSLAGIRTERRVEPGKITVAITNEKPYTYKIRWSVRTKQSLDEEVGEAAARGGDAEAQTKIRKYYQRKLWRRHGKGAPTEQLAGKHVWTTLIASPLKRRQAALIERLREDLARLAGA